MAGTVLPQTDLFVIFEVEGGCACCRAGRRETVIPKPVKGMTRDDLRRLLAAPHGVDFTAIVLPVVADAAADREMLDQLREAFL